MMKIRVLALAAAFGLVTLVGCGPVPSTGKLKEASDKSKEVIDKGVDKSKEVIDKGVDKAKEGWDKIKDTVGKWKEGYDKDIAAIDVKVKELDAKRTAAAGGGAEAVKKAETDFKEANTMADNVKVAIKDSFDKAKDGTTWEEFKKNAEPKIAALKEKLGVK